MSLGGHYGWVEWVLMVEIAGVTGHFTAMAIDCAANAPRELDHSWRSSAVQ